uniref:NR LBD domain-containing protein n=1 Tax=Panagrellus redivivus TaxID=6233 RepID=A0A7E4ZQG2_PANRE
MFERIYTDYLSAEHRLQRVLVQWKSLKPRFATKKAAVLTPETRSLLILSLKQQNQYVKQALQKVYEMKQCWNIYKKIDYCIDYKFFNKAHAKITKSLESESINVANQIEIVLLEFQNPLIAPIPFKSLPYEFQNRLIQLLPPKDVTTFKSSGNNAFKAVKKHRPNFVNLLYIVHMNVEVQEILDSHKLCDKIAITETDFLPLKITSCYVGSELSIFLSVPEAYFKAMDIISGDFNVIKIYGYTILWTQAFELINISSRLKYVFFELGMIEDHEFNDLFNALMLLLKTRKLEYV